MASKYFVMGGLTLAACLATTAQARAQATTCAVDGAYTFTATLMTVPAASQVGGIVVFTPPASCSTNGAVGTAAIDVVFGNVSGPLSRFAVSVPYSVTDGVVTIQGPQGLIGPQGLQGVQGLIGPQGPVGPVASRVVAAVSNTLGSVLAVVLGGTAVPLNNVQALLNTVLSGANDAVTVNEAGVYRLNYCVRTTLGLLVNSRLTINGVPAPETVLESLVSTSEMCRSAVRTLAAGDTVQLELYGLLGAATLLPNGGADLLIEKIGE